MRAKNGRDSDCRNVLYIKCYSISMSLMSISLWGVYIGRGRLLEESAKSNHHGVSYLRTTTEYHFQ